MRVNVWSHSTQTKHELSDKRRKTRIYIKKHGPLLPTKYDKITLTRKQLGNLIVRVRINQMEEDEIY